MKKHIFISSVQSEFAEERKRLAEYIRQDALFSRYFEPFLFEELPAQDVSAQVAYLEQAAKSEVYILLVGEQYGYQEDSDEGGEYGPERGDYAAFKAAELVSGEDGRVHRQHSGRTLGECDDVRELVIAYPPARAHLALDDGYHGVASADREGSHLGENAEYFHQSDALFHPLFR